MLGPRWTRAGTSWQGSSTRTRRTRTETKKAVGISATTTRADVSDVRNNSPDFNLNKTERDIDEDAAVGALVGDPVDVDKNEDEDVLTYSFVTEANRQP